MAQYQSTPAHTATIHRPPCLMCGTPMWLASIEPESQTHDKRTFECPVCEIHEIELVKFK
jgi:hypothetical protein